METLLTKLRQVLKYEVSIETLIEVALWLAIPYLLIGLTWAFFHVELVQQLQDHQHQVARYGIGAHAGHGQARVGRSPPRGPVRPEPAAVVTR